jgi:hypothetical protein
LRKEISAKKRKDAALWLNKDDEWSVAIVGTMRKTELLNEGYSRAFRSMPLEGNGISLSWS